MVRGLWVQGFGLTAIWGFFSPGTAWACAVCGLDGDQAFLWSFLFLISMPFAVTGVVGGYLVYSYRRNQKEAQNNFSADASPQQQFVSKG